MSLFGSLMGDLEEDPIFGAHMRQMRQMNNMMNSLFNFPDPFGGLGGMQAIQGPGAQMFVQPRQIMPMFTQNMGNRLLNAGIPQEGVGFASSSVFSMTTGPDGKPQIYKASTSTKAGPGGVRETRKTLEDSRSGTKKMSIGHHIGDRAHVIEKSQDLRTGQMEENEELINLDEEEKEVFNREFTNKTRALTGRRHGPEIQAIMPASSQSEDDDDDVKIVSAEPPKALTYHKMAPSNVVVSPNRPHTKGSSSKLGATPRRAIRAPSSSPLATPSSMPGPSRSQVTTSVHPHPYNPTSRKRAIKGPYTKHQ